MVSCLCNKHITILKNNLTCIDILHLVWKSTQAKCFPIMNIFQKAKEMYDFKSCIIKGTNKIQNTCTTFPIIVDVHHK